MQPDPIVLVPIVLLVIGVVIFFGWRHAKLRREAFARVAQEAGLQFEPHAGKVPFEWRRMDGMDDGHSPRAANLLHGERGGRRVQCFDFTFKTGSGKNETTHSRAIVLVEVPRHWPRVCVVPENVGHKLIGLVGVEEIDFESQDFSDRFWVRASDRRFAYDLIHPRFMEWLLEGGPQRWEIEDGLLCVWENGHVKPAVILARIDAALALLAHVPPRLWERGAASGAGA